MVLIVLCVYYNMYWESRVIPQWAEICNVYPVAILMLLQTISDINIELYYHLLCC